jgi:hypothetical protein
MDRIIKYSSILKNFKYLWRILLPLLLIVVSFLLPILLQCSLPCLLWLQQESRVLFVTLRHFLLLLFASFHLLNVHYSVEQVILKQNIWFHIKIIKLKIYTACNGIDISTLTRLCILYRWTIEISEIRLHMKWNWEVYRLCSAYLKNFKWESSEIYL